MCVYKCDYFSVHLCLYRYRHFFFFWLSNRCSDLTSWGRGVSWPSAFRLHVQSRVAAAWIPGRLKVNRWTPVILPCPSPGLTPTNLSPVFYQFCLYINVCVCSCQTVSCCWVSIFITTTELTSQVWEIHRPHRPWPSERVFCTQRAVGAPTGRVRTLGWEAAQE